jgi:hypothetical protein
MAGKSIKNKRKYRALKRKGGRRGGKKKAG